MYDLETKLEQRCSEKNHVQSATNSVVFSNATIQQHTDGCCAFSKYTISRNTSTAVHISLMKSTSAAIIKPTVNSNEKQRKTTTPTFHTLPTWTTTTSPYEITTSTYGIQYLHSIQKVGNQFLISDNSAFSRVIRTTKMCSTTPVGDI